MPLTTTAQLTIFRTPAEAHETIAALVALLDGAQHSIHCLLYALTHPALIAALERAHARGVDVRIILDQSQSAGAVEAKDLHALLLVIPPPCVRIGTAPTGQIMHQKAATIDGGTVVTGSINWTTRAVSETNDLLIIASPLVAAAYGETFDALAAWIDAHEQRLQPTV